MRIEQLVSNYTRAGKHGKTIVCPQCDKNSTVYHFSWSALSCQHCHNSINKLDWRIYDPN